MNHAANNIEAKSKSLKDLLKERKYQVKYFQREYRWQKNHIEDLIIDLERTFFSNFKVEHTREDVPDYDCYYMGPIVLYREKSSFVIVDGQQRLTSFTLLLIYLNHLQNDLFKSNPKKKLSLDEYIYSKPYEKETFNLEIPQREGVLNSLFRKLIIKDEDIENESSHNILDRYKDIEELFPPTLNLEYVLPVFINWVVEKLIFTEIMAQTSESAYTIFETMNDRGLNLTQSEMLKSYLLSNVRDEDRIKELDVAWKSKIAILKSYSSEEDQDFFKAWLRAKYAVSIRLSEKGSTNEDFEKISTRFSSWVQDSSKRLLLLDPDKQDTYYYFVHSDFHFFSDLYIKLINFVNKEQLPEHRIRLAFYKGISPSLALPFILSPIQKIDTKEIVDEKIELTVKFLDCFAIYRLLINEPITHSSIRNAIYLKIKENRNNESETLKIKLKSEIEEYKLSFLKNITYIPHDANLSKYILSRIYKNKYPNEPFENIYFQRKKDSFILYQFLTSYDFDSDVNKIPGGLKDILTESLCTYCLIPKGMNTELDKMSVLKRIQFLINKNYILEYNNSNEINSSNLQDFLVDRNKKIKETVINIWKI